MVGYFMDSSALVKRYGHESGSVWLSAHVTPAAGHDIYIARITTVEVIAALTCRARGGTIPTADARAACLLCRNDVPHDYEVIGMTATLLNRAVTLAETHGLRGYDAVQLVAAYEVNALSIAHGLPALTVISAISADSELNAAATEEGLLIDDPHAHPSAKRSKKRCQNLFLVVCPRLLPTNAL